MTTISVVLVDDHALFRSGVRSELEAKAGVDVIGEAGSVAEAVECVMRLEPDVVLLDVHLPDGSGADVVPRTQSLAKAPKYLALSVSDDPEDVIAVIRAGARGYVTKTISSDELADAITRVHDGDAVFSPRLAGFVLDAFASGPAGPAQAARRSAESEPDAELEQLTPREREVLQHIARGYLYKEIALRLGISVKTVEAHVSAVLRKLQLSTRHELTRWAWERFDPPN